jgi:pyridoxal phosphate enzyme (YggS family)
VSVERDPAEDVQSLAERLAGIRARVADAAMHAGRDPGEVLLVAVTKTVTPERIRRAYEVGLRIFGENRVQEAQEKRAALTMLKEAHWELIGHLQSNKAARTTQLFERVQSVDSVPLAQTLEAHAAQAGRTLPILMEVNVAGEASKSGFALSAVPEAARAIAALPHLRPEGLMTVAPLVDDVEQVRPVFVALRELRDRLRREMPTDPNGGWPHLSMGMSDDFPVAVEEGATIIRLGRALFGPRPVP